MFFLSTWTFIVSSAVFGNGYLLRRYCFKEIENSNPFINFFLGIILIGFLSSSVSLFTNINILVSTLFYSSGVIGSFYFLKRNLFYRKYHFQQILTVVTFLSIILFFSYKDYPYFSDTDVYHYQLVKWNKNYGTVKGLANLSIFFGLNSYWHSIAAVFDKFSLEGRTPWILPILSYSSTLFYFSWEVCFSSKPWARLYSCLVLSWLSINILTWGFPSLHYDFLPLVFNILVTFEILKLFEKDNLSTKISHYTFIFTLAVTSFVLKPLTITSLLFCSLTIFWILHKTYALNIRSIIHILIIPTLIIVSWLTKNTMISGYPVFPSPHLSIETPWTTPKASVIDIFNDILYWARTPGPDFRANIDKGFSNWFPIWLENMLISKRAWPIGIIPLLTGTIIWFFAIIKLPEKRNAIYIFCWMLFSILFWFATAPDIRFGDGLFIAYLGTSIFFIANFKTNKIMIRLSTWLNYCIMITLCVSMYTFLIVGKRGPISLYSINKYLPGPVKLVNAGKEGEGLKVWTPHSIASCTSNNETMICLDHIMPLYKEIPACGNAPLPCTTSIPKGLRMFRPGDLSKGFFIDIGN
ncbi:LIC_10190 family membrane protein [Halobacteriovorax marinus]|uniref:LIC_10190 family membrane protein n=1 Tax=Halobacteriovorax marinus TaxID=97084 RepID=UPI003A943DF1